MTLSDENKAELIRLLDSHVFLAACELVREVAASKTDFSRPAADLGLLMAHERGVNEFPSLLREVVMSANKAHQAPPAPKSLIRTTPGTK